MPLTPYQRKVRNKMMKKILLTSLLMGASKYALAIASCSTTVPVNNFTATLSPGDISIGPDASLGHVIYQLNFNDPGIPADTAVCGPPPFSVPQILSYSRNPLPLSNWNANPFAGRVYQTSIPGVGMAVSSDLTNQALPTTAYTTSNNSSGGVVRFGVKINAVLTFIKIGPITPGSINGSQLPTVQLDLGPSPTVSGTTRIYNLSFAGILNITTPTCTTPDVFVPLGSYDVKTFTGFGYTTAWRPVPITLTNCGQFNGVYNANFPVVSTGTGASTITGNGGNGGNAISISFSPTAPLLSAPPLTNVMEVRSNNGSPAATGIGIQMGNGDPSVNGQINPLRFNYSNSSGSSSGAYEFPRKGTGNSFVNVFSARYIQVSENVTPGRADGSVVFTVTYR